MGVDVFRHPFLCINYFIFAQILNIMKKLLLFISLCTLLLSACKKDSKTTTDPVLDVRIDGLYDFSLGYDDRTYDYEFKTIALAISQLTLSQENVSLNLEGLPTGIEVKFSTTSGIPNYTSLMEVTLNNNIKSGVYPIKLVAKNASGVKKTYTFTVTVALPCNFSYAGNYEVKETIDGVEQALYSTVLNRMGIDGNIIYDYKNYYAMDFNCTAKTVVLYSQDYVFNNPNSGKISGTGTLTDNVITLNCVYEPSVMSGGGPNKIIKKVFTRK
jgi:hypothetical protein